MNKIAVIELPLARLLPQNTMLLVLILTKLKLKNFVKGTMLL